MNLDIEGETISLDKFNKCGEVYRSPRISDKQYAFLSCIYCKDVSWNLETFLRHMHSTHSLEDICSNLYKEELSNEGDSLNNETLGELENKQNEEDKQNLSRESGNDPLNEGHYHFSELLPLPIKEESLQVVDNAKVNFKPDCKINSNDDSENKILDINGFEYYNDISDEDYEPEKASSDEEDNTGEYLNEEYDEDDDDHDDIDTNLSQTIPKDHSKTTNLKRFTKNREFIKAIVSAYQKQNFLWDSAYKHLKKSSPEKQNALQELLKDINGKFEISANQQQIERIIKRLKMRFIYEMRLKDKGESYNPVWFYDLLTFLEPHFKDKKVRIGICNKLNDNQFLQLIKLLKENECFWNENNIYHTSVKNKQEILTAITDKFAKICELENFNSEIMQNTIDEVLQIAREENNKAMRHIAKDNEEEYKSSNKYYKELHFLFPHVGPFKCNYCPKAFIDIYAYKFHISRHEGTKPFKCMLCPRELTHKKEFVCHLRRHTKECPFECDKCDKSFPSKKEWHRHIIKHGSKPYVCELCADSFYTQHQLTNHMKNHNNIRDHVCPECGKGFTHRGLLRQHLQTHNKTKCICSICNNIYSNPRSLRKHFVRVHESGQELTAAALAQYNCKICKIVFPTIQDAKQHRKEHKQSNPTERKHVCDICGNHFAYPRNLADHKKTHSNIRDQVCDVCGKAFTNANLLNQHKNVHAGEKFVCKACGKDYAHYRGLCRHITKVHGINIKDLDTLLKNQKLTTSSSQQYKND